MQKDGYKSPSDLVVFIEMDEQLEKKLQKLEVEFERLIFCIFFLCFQIILILIFKKFN
jgi:hypothetical protein